MTKMRLLSRLPLLAIALPMSTIAQPPPPPPPGLLNYVHFLDDAYNRRDLAAYAEPFAADVKVYVDGVLVAANRDALLAHTKEEFKQSLHIGPVSSAQGSQVIAFEIVTGCIPDHPDPRIVYHGCPNMRAVRYDIGDDKKINEVFILQAKAWNIHSEPRNWWEFP